VETGSPELSRFIASYKKRRLAAKLVWGLTAAVGIVLCSTNRRRGLSLRLPLEQQYLLAYAFGASVLLGLSSWLWARCPECGRYIGTSRRRRADFTSRPPCELEQACAGELALVDED
jgi:hypothetical protein